MPRHVLVILCDQLRKDFLPAYGCEAIATPALDRLAAMGVTFDRAITMPVCAPSRATMMTGRYPCDHGVWSNDLPFRDGLEYIPQRMNELGYRTGSFGKLHHAPPKDAKGFQVVYQMEENRLGEEDDYLQWLRGRRPDAELFNLKPGELRFALDEDEHYERWIADRAIDFLTEPEDRPRFAWLSFQGPHDPLDPPAAYAGACDESKLPGVLVPDRPFDIDVHEVRAVTMPRPHDASDMAARRRAYAESIVFIDAQIGRVLDALEAAGRLDGTTIVFSADHGDMLHDLDLGEKGPFPYPAQLEVPMILANHPGIPAGTRSDALVGTIDIPGTALDVAGADRGIGLSRSLVDAGSPEPTHPREVNYTEFCNAFKCVEDDRYRFAYYPFTSQMQLFDLAEDPLCLSDLSGRPEHARRLLAMLRRVVDFGCLMHGVRIEAHDLVPAQQAALAQMWPEYADEMPIMFPLTATQRDALAAAGLAADMNAVFEHRTPTRRYQPAYWEEPS